MPKTPARTGAGTRPLPRPGGRRALVALVSLALLLLGGCATDPVEDYAPAIGSNERVPGMDALSVAIVTDGDGAGTVVGTLLNTGDRPDALVGARVTAERASVDVVLEEGPVELPPGEMVPLARRNALSLSSPDFPVGFFVELTLRFREGPPVEMLVPVEPQRGPYAEVEVTAPPDGDISPP